MEAVSCWVLDHPRLLYLGDYNAHEVDVTSTQVEDLVNSMVALGLFENVMVPTHQGGHILDLIFAAGVKVD